MLRRLSASCAVISLVALSACGGSGGGGGVNSTPTPVPTPTPTPTGNTSLTALQVSETFPFAANSNIRYALSRATGGATPQGGASSSDAGQVRYDATTGSYTLIGLAQQQVTFGSADRTAASSNATITTYQRTAGTRQDNLALFNPGSGNPVLTLTYTSYGAQQSVTDNGTSLGVDTTFFTFGIPTAASDVPRTGSATYSTNLDGQFADASGAYALGGTSSLTADFAAATVAVSMTPAGRNVVTGAGKAFGTMTVSAPIQSGTNRFGGSGTANAIGYRAGIQGAFYGPQAAEVGGVVTIVGNNGVGTGAIVGKKTRMVLLAAGLALASQAAGQAVAQCDGRPCVTGLSAPALFAIAAEDEKAGRTAEATAILRTLTRDPNADYRNEARFRLGKLHERTGDRAAAIALYRAILDEKPDANRVRLDLARLLAITGDEAAARRELRTAGAAGLPDDVARVVDQFATALRSRRSLGATVELAIAPDSNINASTGRRTIETVIADLPLDRDARARTGIGLSLSGQGFWRAKLAPQTWLTRLSGRADLYRDSRFRDVSVSLATGPEYQLGRLRVRPAAIASRRWYGGQPYSHGYGGTLNLLRPIGATAQVEIEASALVNRFRVRDQDGGLYDVSLAYDRAFDARTSGRLAVRATRQDARDAGFALTTAAIDALVARRIGRQSAFVQMGASRTTADGRLFLFSETRRDRRWDATGGVLLRRWRFKDLSPVVRVTHSESRSTIGLYDFTRTRVEFALSREF